MSPHKWTTRADIESCFGLAVVATTVVVLAVFALLVLNWWRP